MYFTHVPYVFLPLALAGNMTPIVVCVCALSYRTCLRRITVQHHDVQHVRFIELFIYIYIYTIYILHMLETQVDMKPMKCGCL